MTLAQILQRNIDLLESCGVAYQQWTHEPILDFEMDGKIGAELGWTATPTKSLFLRLKNGGNALLLTHRDARLDSKQIKTLLGKRPSIASDEEMITQLGCMPGAVCPFALPEDIPLVVDEVLFTFDELMYTPGPPELTFAFPAKALPDTLGAFPNPVYYLNA